MGRVIDTKAEPPVPYIKSNLQTSIRLGDLSTDVEVESLLEVREQRLRDHHADDD